jgi:hypothetical protein
MTRALSALLPFLLTLSAAHAEIAGENPAADETNLLGTAVFIALFVAFCAGFLWFVWKNEQKAKQKNGADGTKP